MIRTYLLYAIISLMGWTTFAQNQVEKTYSLAECITIALENNLDIKSAAIQANSAKVNHQQSKAELLPSINGNFNLGVNTGRSIDPFTNDFINQELTFSNAGLSINATVFNGFRLINTTKQNRLNRKASEMELEATKQDITLRVTLGYLQVLNSKAILELAEARLKVTQQQLKIQEDFYKNESGNPADYTDILGQVASDETNIVIARNSWNSARLNLMQLLNVKDMIALDTKDFMLAIKAYDLSADTVYQDAVQNWITFKAGELRVEAAKKGVSIAKAQFTPTVSVFGGVNTNYSSAAQTFTAVGSSIVETGDFITLDGQNLSVLSEETNFDAQRIGFRDQLDNNLNTVIGLSVQVPFFNGLRAKNNVRLEKNRVDESIVALERTHVDIKNTITQVHFDMTTAYLRYKSFQKQVEAFQESFRVNEIRFNNGISNFLNYITSKNNLENAKANLINAQYEYLLRVKILEYYRGNFG
ncbi:TolC family protein [uncultured Dokdonia sp.]|uniref:TolC family protein n=1 Tax=uncultured Dokdonia sp. TaxID=575653 RepID=UPI00262F0FCD|nr:TolC family protein [uncultured Dokdonia sp.]